MNQQVIDFLKIKGVKVLQEEDIDDKFLKWRSWYRGKVDGFHDYYYYQGKKKVKTERLSLNMAQRVCQRWADLLLNEKVSYQADDEYTQEVIDRLLEQTNFRVRGNNLLEASYAMGGGFLIEYWDGKQTSLKYVTQDYAYPITYDSGRLTECAFCSEKVIDNERYVYLETHTLNDKDEYVIDNYLLAKGKNAQVLTEVDPLFYAEHSISPKVETHRKEPLFQMIRPNVANKDEFNSPFGTSVYNGATDILKSIDMIFDSYYKEFYLGKKRIFVPNGVTTFAVGYHGETVQAFDPNDEVFYSVPPVDGHENEIRESNMALRVGEYNTGLQTQLNLLSQAVGFGSEGFKWDQGSVHTATQIISQNSEMFRSIKKHELLLKGVVIGMIKGLLFIERQYTGDQKIDPETDITIDFDDSIIEDSAEVQRRALLEVNSGLIDAVEYFVQVYHYTDEQAEDFVNKMRARQPQPMTEPELEEE